MAEKDKELEDDIVVVDESEPQEEKKAPETEEDSDGESQEIDSSKEQEKKKRTPKKRGNDRDKRINELWLKVKEKEDEVRRTNDIASSERAKNGEYEKITASALEENINTKRELLTERLIRAQENGDTKKSAEITAELSKVEAQSAQIERYKLESQVQGQKQPPAERQDEKKLQSPDEVYERMSPSGKKWLDDNNDWYDANGENHDPEKSADVTYYAQTLEAEYKASGRTAEIGTRAYFRKIDDYIKNNWDNDMEDSEEPQTQSRKDYAAPVGNRHNSPSSPTKKEYKITQSEKEFALSRDTKDSSGKPLSDNDKLKRFIKMRENVPANGPISMKTITNKGA